MSTAEGLAGQLVRAYVRGRYVAVEDPEAGCWHVYRRDNGLTLHLELLDVAANLAAADRLITEDEHLWDF